LSHCQSRLALTRQALILASARASAGCLSSRRGKAHRLAESSTSRRPLSGRRKPMRAQKDSSCAPSALDRLRFRERAHAKGIRYCPRGVSGAMSVQHWPCSQAQTTTCSDK
jgi:hypothetical protein